MNNITIGIICNTSWNIYKYIYTVIINGDHIFQIKIALYKKNINAEINLKNKLEILIKMNKKIYVALY